MAASGGISCAHGRKGRYDAATGNADSAHNPARSRRHTRVGRRIDVGGCNRGLHTSPVARAGTDAGVALVLGAVLSLVVPVSGAAQRATGLQPEGRVEVIAGRTTQLLGGVGVNVPAGVYLRLGLSAAVGGVIAGAGPDEASGTVAHVDVRSRFHLDPFRQSRVGLYGLAGVSAMYHEDDDWKPRIVLGLGLEGPARRGVLTGVEFALGGGTRIAIVLRRARPAAR